jgi:transposase-like protein
MADAKRILAMSAAELEAAFPAEDDCCAHFVARRWPHGVTCPRCGSHDVGRIKSTKWKWRCSCCGRGGAYHFSHIAGTTLENTKLPLRDWFRVVHLKLTCTAELSASEIKQRLGVSYKTAWTMCNRLDAVLADDSLRKAVGIPNAPLPPDNALGIARERSGSPVRDVSILL